MQLTPLHSRSGPHPPWASPKLTRLLFFRCITSIPWCITPGIMGCSDASSSRLLRKSFCHWFCLLPTCCILCVKTAHLYAQHQCSSNHTSMPSISTPPITTLPREPALSSLIPMQCDHVLSVYSLGNLGCES